MNDQFRVYAAEIEDGLRDKILSPESLAAVALARIESKADWAIFQHATRDIALAEQALGLSKDDFDLHPIHAILVSTGWNKNDDVFDVIESWKARHSPEDKPFNLGHEPSKIIGHITGSTVIDDSRQIVSDESKLPDKFHILTRSVIYKHITSRDQALQEEIAELIEGIARNEWFVSMEALFNNFDYGLCHPDGTQQVVARQENTAFLTKHLRVYGGTGEYEGRRIGRVLRNITFSGKALVKNPANPSSIIFNDTDMFKGVLANENEVKVFITGASNMSDEILRELKDKNAGLEKKLADASKKLEEMGEAAVKAKLDSKDATIAELKEKNGKQAKLIAEIQTSIDDLEKSRDEAVASKIELEEKMAKLEEKIQASEAEAVKVSRTSVLVDKGVDKAEAEQLVAEFSDLSDDKFNKLVELKSELAAAKKACTEEEEETPNKSKAEQEEETSETSEAETDETLSEAEEEEEAALASEEITDDDKKLQESIASFMQWQLSKRKQKQD